MSQIGIFIPQTSNGVLTLTGDSGGAVPPTAGNINIVGAGGVSTTGNPGTSTITITAGAAIATTYTTDAGIATPAANNLDVLGNNLITTSGAGDTLVVELTNGTNGQIPIAGGTDPVWANITSTDGSITITNGANSIDLSTTGMDFAWQEETGATVALAVNNGYIMNNAGGVTGTLPATAAVGDIIAIVGKGAGGWLIAQNGGQTIHFGNLDTTTGVTGSLGSMLRYDCVEIICITANTDFVVRSSVGNLVVT